jgi:hypothetical protein
VGSYTSTTHYITFAPLSPGRFREDRILQFEGTDETIKISIVATSIKVPIYVKEPIVDMQCCVYDKLYRAKVRPRECGRELARQAPSHARADWAGEADERAKAPSLARSGAG